MKPIDTDQVEAAEVVLPCTDLDDTLDFFTQTLGFRIDVIFPAESPRTAVVSGYGIRIRLDRDSDAAPSTLLLSTADDDPVSRSRSPLTAPNGTRIEFRSIVSSLALAPLEPSLIVRKIADDDAWRMGRAGMQYRDLIPGRLGGRYIASHIRIPVGGPVPDYVHHHHVLFQVIYCYKGWVRVVYEDQGPPFVMEAGDCVVQPPHIRHRVLECSDGFEVVEIGSPAEHETLVDHDLELPTTTLNPNRDFGGQRFKSHQYSNAEWTPWCSDGFEMRDTGIRLATDDLVSVIVVRQTEKPTPLTTSHETDLVFNFVLQGSITLDCPNGKHWNLFPGDSFTIPAKMNYTLSECTPDLEFLEVTSPARFEIT